MSNDFSETDKARLKAELRIIEHVQQLFKEFEKRLALEVHYAMDALARGDEWEAATRPDEPVLIKHLYVLATGAGACGAGYGQALIGNQVFAQISDVNCPACLTIIRSRMTDTIKTSAVVHEVGGEEKT